MSAFCDPHRAQEILGYAFRDTDLLREALQAPGVGVVIHGQIIQDGNKRLSLLGISLVATAISLVSYENGHSKVQTSAVLQSRTAPANLAQLARRSTLDMCIAINPNQTEMDLPPVLLADTIKAVLAAVWIDCGLNMELWKPVANALGFVAPCAVFRRVADLCQRVIE